VFVGLDFVVENTTSFQEALKTLKRIFWSLPPGGRSQTIYDMGSDIETTIALAKTHDALPQAASSGDLTQGFR
jgi:hypothetical protein